MFRRAAALFQPGSLTRLLYRLRTEADGPGRQAAAIGVGTYIGCTPFYGFHLLISIAVASIFRLNRLKVYLAANISNPLIAPLLVATELQVGGWFTRGAWYSADTFRQAAILGVAEDLLLGSVIVGGALGVATAAGAYMMAKRRTRSAAVSRLLEGASSRYLTSGSISWEMANGKVNGDPVYVGVLQRGILPSSGTVLDIGCGRGLMLALLAEAKRAVVGRNWPDEWPAPPRELELVGVEMRPRMVKIARLALKEDASIVDGDVRTIDLPRASAILLFDIIHLMPRADQDALIARIRTLLSPGGVLVMREADAGGGWRFLTIRLFNATTRFFQGQWRRRFHFRTADDWRAALEAEGFSVEIEPMGAGTPFANIAVYARLTQTF